MKVAHRHADRLAAAYLEGDFEGLFAVAGQIATERRDSAPRASPATDDDAHRAGQSADVAAPQRAQDPLLIRL